MEVFELQGEYMRKMSDEEFYRFCRDNPDLKIERNANGNIEIMSPTFYPSGDVNSTVIEALMLWNSHYKKGKVLLPELGFKLQSGAIRSRNGAWISNEKKSVIKEYKHQFPPVCPEFILEVKSESDSIQILRTKMHEWITTGCQLAWLIDSEEEKVYIYKENGSEDKIEGFNQTLSGEDVLPGFELDLRELRIQ